MNFPSKLIEDAVNEFSRLPGVGKKTALRFVLHLLKKEQSDVLQLSDAIKRMREEIQYCKICFNISDGEKCSVCSNSRRDERLLCVVESIKDVINIENTNQYNGRYHVLGGVISPIEGIGPEQLHIDQLIDRVKNENVEEVIMALNPTMDGDTTIFFISRKLAESKVRISTLARGVAFGGDLSYVDEFTLARSLQTRRPFESYLSKQ